MMSPGSVGENCTWFSQSVLRCTSFNAPDAISTA